MAEPNAQQLARQRLAVIGDAAFAPKPKIDRRSKEYRDKECEASKRYRETPKGKLTNSQKCMIYQRNHPEKVKGYVMRYQSKWKMAHGGINMSAWNYWKRRLNRGEIVPEDVPHKYEKCLNEWRIKNGNGT